MKTTNFNTWFEVQKVTNKNYSKEQFDSIRDILEECWNYSQSSFEEHNDYEEESIEDLQNRIEELEDVLNEIHSLSGV